MVPAWPSTVPALLKSRPMLEIPPPPDFTNDAPPRLLNVARPPPVAAIVPFAVMFHGPVLLITVSGPMRNDDPEYVVAPAVLSVRPPVTVLKNDVPPISIGPLALNTPVPVMLPPLKVVWPETVTVPSPPSELALPVCS